MLALHVTCVTITLVLVFFADEQAISYLWGRKETLSPCVVTFLHYAVAAGLGGLILTGGFLYAQDPGFYWSEPAFIAKMIAVTALIINGAFLERFSFDATRRSFTALAKREQWLFYVSGAVSALGWLTALICGLLL